MFDKDLLNLFLSPIFPSFILFITTIAIGYLFDYRIRGISNKEILRVVVWLDEEAHKTAQAKGFIPVSKSGWGPLTGFPPYKYRVWAWIYKPNLRPKIRAKVAPYGIAFDVQPRERIFRFLSKAFGPTVLVQGTKQGLDLQGRSPDFTLSRPVAAKILRARRADNIAATAIALFGLCYVLVLAPGLSIVIMASFAISYWISLKIVGLT